MSNTDIDRAADLHYAFQHGQDAARGDFAAVERVFIATFGNDAEAQQQFDEGFASAVRG